MMCITLLKRSVHGALLPVLCGISRLTNFISGQHAACSRVVSCLAWRQIRNTVLMKMVGRSNIALACCWHKVHPSIVEQHFEPCGHTCQKGATALPVLGASVQV